MQQNQSLSLRAGALSLLIFITATAARAADKSFISNLNTVDTVSTTVPSNGDVNPYRCRTRSHNSGKSGRWPVPHQQLQ